MLSERDGSVKRERERESKTNTLYTFKEERQKKDGIAKLHVNVQIKSVDIHSLPAINNL